ncbi:MAG: type II toxin-antitoxin system VapC family toxin [Bdellovibrionales bacterium]
MPNYLLDVNVLVAHALLEHVHHKAVVRGLKRLARQGSRFHVCPIVQLGLIRNMMRIGSLHITDAKQLLENERINLNLRFLADSIGADELPRWVQGYRQTTDAYLSTLAQSNGLKLLTIDKAIPHAEQLAT